jgi:hypothetical protein
VVVLESGLNQINGRIERRARMNKETSKQRRKLSADSLIKTGKKEEVELTEEQLGQASGGKHLAGVKYEDITVNCGKK